MEQINNNNENLRKSEAHKFTAGISPNSPGRSSFIERRK